MLRKYFCNFNISALDRNLQWRPGQTDSECVGISATAKKQLYDFLAAVSGGHMKWSFAICISNLKTRTGFDQ